MQRYSCLYSCLLLGECVIMGVVFVWCICFHKVPVYLVCLTHRRADPFFIKEQRCNFRTTCALGDKNSESGQYLPA